MRRTLSTEGRPAAVRRTLVPVLLITLIALGVAIWLMVRVLDAAAGINDDASAIARNGRGINTATDAVVQLHRTNETARSILQHAQPLSGQLARIVDRAHAIDGTAGAIDTTAGAIDGSAAAINGTAGRITSTAGTIDQTAGAIEGTAGHITTTAGSIEGTAGAINGTAGHIDSTAGGINTQAANILTRAGKIDNDVRLINVFLEQSIRIGSAIEDDTGDIVAEARNAHHYAACIDQKVGGRRGTDGHCETIKPQLPHTQAGSR